MVNSERPLPSLHPNEEERLVAVNEILPEGGLGDGAPEDPMLQNLCKTICKIFKVPIAGVSVVQRDTYSMRACQGLPPQFKIPRHDAFCAWSLLYRDPETLVIEDMREDQRFKDHPNVQPDAGGLRFYAGAPLISSTNMPLGSVCILDVNARKLSAEEYNVLGNFSEMAIRRLEEKHRPSVRGNGKMLRTAQDLTQAVVLCDLSNYRWWSVLYANEAFAGVAGIGHETLSESSFWKLFRPADQRSKAKVLEDLEDAIETGKDFGLSVRRRESVLDADPALKDAAFSMTFKPATTQNLGAHASRISVPNIIAAVELGAANSSYYFAVVATNASQQAPPGRDEAETVSRKRSGTKSKQQTFYSKAYQSSMPVMSKQPVDEGIKDVTMGVLCCQTETGQHYRGRWKRKPVSVKVLETSKDQCVRAPAFGVAYVPKETALCIGLEHPNIVQVFKVVVDQFEVEKVRAWLVREWTKTGGLDDAIQRGWLLSGDKTPNWKLILSTAVGIGQAMAYLHSEGIIFGSLDSYSISLDAKEGSNKEMQQSFTPKLQEFGSSAKAEESAPAGKILVPSHAAPEVFAKSQISQASDVYAFGMLWWEMVESQVLWPSLNAEQVQKRAANRQLPTFTSQVDAGVKDLFEDCLAHDPRERPSFQEVVARLSVMQGEQAEGKALTGVSLEHVPTQTAPAARRLFNNLQPTDNRKPSDTKSKLGDSGSSILQQATQDTAEEQKKSVFKRFASKFKT